MEFYEDRHKTISSKLPIELHRRIHSEADSEEISTSQWIREHFELFFAKNDSLKQSNNTIELAADTKTVVNIYTSPQGGRFE